MAAPTTSALKAVVLGATGATGQELVKDLIRSEKWSKIVTIGRRPLQLDDELKAKSEGRLEQLTIDMDKMAEQAAQAFQGADSVFCTLGTTRKDAGSAAQFKKVDYEWVAVSAKLAKEGGCHHYSLLTAKGSNAKLWSSDFILFGALLYLKTKGLAEEAVKSQGFPLVSIFQPGLIYRKEVRLVEKLLGPLTGGIQTAELAKSMVLDAEACGAGTREGKTVVYSMDALMRAAKEGGVMPRGQVI